MAHLNDGTLRRMVDDADFRAGADAAHLDGCAECKARFDTISRDASSIAALLSTAEPHVDVARAFNRVQAAHPVRPRFGLRLPVARPGRRPVVFALVAAIALVALLGTVVAQGVKTNYSPNTVQPVPVTVADMEALSQLADYGTITWTKQPNIAVATSAADAEAMAGGGLHAPVVSALPTGVSTTVTYVAMQQTQAIFTFSAVKAADAAARHGKSLPAMPAGMDGATLTVTLGPAIGEVFGNLKQPSSSTGSGPSDINLPQLVVGVSSVPSATSTQVSQAQMVDFILAQPGISPDLAAAVRAFKNPETTLPIPIPIKFATSKTVTVHGAQGVALGDNTGVGAGVIWVKNGVLYGVAGTVKQSDALSIANNLK